MADRQENKKTVVVVDDEPIIRMDLGQMLEELNYEVVAVPGISGSPVSVHGSASAVSSKVLVFLH